MAVIKDSVAFRPYSITRTFAPLTGSRFSANSASLAPSNGFEDEAPRQEVIRLEFNPD